ncbi:MAG: HYR domain-containing protein, partial [Thermoproteota archaeon]|nr:HYR domain-containing protein [Thermoproteota archaeon]
TTMAQQTTEGGAGATTTGTDTTSTDQSAITGGSTSQLTFTLRMEDPVMGAAGGGASTTSSSATSSSILPTKNLRIEVSIVRGNEAPVSLPINVTIPANVNNNLELCVSSTTMMAGAEAAAADEICDPVLHTIDLTQGGEGAAAASTDTSTTTGTTTSSSSEPTSLISGIEDTTATTITMMTSGVIPITVITPATVQVQDAQVCALLISSGTQNCNQIKLNPEQTAYTPVYVDMTTSSPTPTIISSQVTDTTTATGATSSTGTTDTAGGAASSTTTTTTTTPSTTTTTPGSTNNNTTNTTGGAKSSLPPPGGRDTTPPTLTVPNDMTLQTNGTTALLVYSVAARDNRDGTATLDEDNQLIQGDNVGGNIMVFCRPTSQYFLPVGNRTVECNAFDAANNTATASFIVSVTPYTPPSSGGGITISEVKTEFSTASGSVLSSTYNGTCPVGANFFGTITDNVGNRDIRYRFIWNDGAGAEVVRHFDQPGSQIVSAGANYGEINKESSHQGWVAIEILQPTHLQSNRAEFEVHCAPTTGAMPGGAADTTAPVIQTVPSIRGGSRDPAGTQVTYSVIATDNIGGGAGLTEDGTLYQSDNVGGSITISCNPASGSIFPIGDTTVKCTATDVAGNTGEASITVTIDLIPPATLADTTAPPAEEEEEEGAASTEDTTATDEGAAEGGDGDGGGEPPATTTDEGAAEGNEGAESPPANEGEEG